MDVYFLSEGRLYINSKIYLPFTITQKLIKEHLVSGDMIPGAEIGLRINQTLTQDATGTMMILELEGRLQWLYRDGASTSDRSQQFKNNTP